MAGQPVMGMISIGTQREPGHATLDEPQQQTTTTPPIDPPVVVEMPKDADAEATAIVDPRD